MNNDVNLQQLFQEGRERMNNIQYHRDAFLPYYDFSDNDAYYAWIGKATRYLNIKYPGDKDVDKFEKLSEERITPLQQSKLLAILEALVVLPEIVKNKEEKPLSSISIVNGQYQSQEQSQNILLEAFLCALHEELSNKQIRELKEVSGNETMNTEEKKESILEKIKGFGKDTLSNIIANVLTNPSVWGMI